MFVFEASTRVLERVTVVDLRGRLSLGPPCVTLRQTVGDLLAAGQTALLLNLADVNYIDSAGIGELANCAANAARAGANCKLLNPSKRAHDLLKLSGLVGQFQIFSSEASALQSFF